MGGAGELSLPIDVVDRDDLASADLSELRRLVGCREEVVPFYVSCGWSRIVAREASIGRTGERVVDEPGSPIMVRAVSGSSRVWPDGDIDLRGPAW